MYVYIVYPILTSHSCYSVRNLADDDVYPASDVTRDRDSQRPPGIHLSGQRVTFHLGMALTSLIVVRLVLAVRA